MECTGNMEFFRYEYGVTEKEYQEQAYWNLGDDV